MNYFFAARMMVLATSYYIVSSSMSLACMQRLLSV
jgi:hypothetical protein